MTDASTWVSRDVSRISMSAIKEMAMRSAKVPGAASLTWGLPSFRTPEHIRQAVVLALEDDPEIGKYALPDGLPELRQIIARQHVAETGITVDPDRNVVVTAGNMEGLNALFHVLIDPGDEIIVTDPGFASHFQQIRLCGGEPVFWKLDEARGWRLDVDALPGLISERTKGIVLVTPSNPTGKIFTEAELRRVGEIARARNLLVLLDDPYSHFVYENREAYFNLASVPELREHVAYLFTFSKTYAMSGWRLGYMIIPDALKREVLKVHDATMICAPRISQVAGLAALTEEPVHLSRFEDILAERRELICRRLDRVGHVFEYVKPEGAYYVFPRVVAEHDDSFAFAIRLLEQARVTVTPGSAFGPSGEHHVRLAYCVAEETIETAFDRIEDYFGRA
ncbi:MAG: pyridoxal phosphate-dependent aminotransferase [Alphaproteobacteria bacterium]|jgi:aspartate/methionine/tyrosine aminotransferase|nr:pyridoxal phosphate-dependent aminotransferase [Alphaproteobacteria bacterium]MDP6814449.1 pyridoxal phosphate-dependent aminotransferase [Alphaproteobacteria bacterium]